MPEILSYDKMTVEMLHSTPNPAGLIGLALSITMKSDPNAQIHALSDKLAQFLIDAEHESPLEHVGYTFLIQNVSRSFLAQITRQRAFKFTSGSQHYQDYSSYPCMVRSDFMGDIPTLALEDSTSTYASLVKAGAPPEEARQVLPNACATNLLMTCDARNLWFFLRQRLCNRNVNEMRIFASRVLSLVQQHFPELYSYAGPQCANGECMQGSMRCAEQTWVQV